jgi:hypothetical protein
LPGLHHIHILDDEEDDEGATVGNGASANFFLSSEEMASTVNRSEVALRLLLELNPDVTGSFATTPDLWDFDFLAYFQQLLQQHREWKQCFILGSDLELPLLQSIARSCAELQLPFLTVHAYGLMGIVQIQTLPLFPIVNPRGQQSTTTQIATIPDFQILHPFPMLYQFMERAVANINSLSSSFDYGHVPYPIILYLIYHKVWKEKYPDQPKPQTMDEKKEFVQMIYQHYHETVRDSFTTSEMTNTSIAKDDNDAPLNVQEAARNAYMAYTERTADVDHLLSLLDRIQQSPSSNQYCQTLALTLRAILQFVQTQQRPPVHGSIPDMTASTEQYIQLQSVYKQQQVADLNVIKGYIQQQNAPDTILPEDDYILAVCQNIHDLDVLETGTRRGRRMAVNNQYWEYIYIHSCFHSVSHGGLSSSAGGRGW